MIDNDADQLITANISNNYTIGYNQTRKASSCFPSQTESHLFRFITNGIFLNGIGCFGIFGNIISMFILSRPQMKSSINYLLIGLARIDTVLILTSIMLFGLTAIYPYNGSLFYYYFKVYPHVATVIYPLANAMQTASVYLTMVVSLERYVAVCHPLKARSLCTYGRAKIYVIGILIFSTLYNLPRLWDSNIQYEWYAMYNTTIYCPVASDFRNNKSYRTIYIHWLYLICMYLLPFVSLAVLNGAIYRQILKANRERQRLSRLRRREISMATMLLCVIIVFFVCNLLAMVINVIDTFEMKVDGLDMIIDLSNLLVTINSSVNFIIYVTFGDKFQRLFLVMFCRHMFFFTRRGSLERATQEDSFTSNGDGRSFRLHRRSGTFNRTTDTRISRLNGRDNGSSKKFVRTPSPGTYYQQQTLPLKKNHSEEQLPPFDGGYGGSAPTVSSSISDGEEAAI